MIAENLYGIPFLTVNVRNVNHANVHTDVTHIGRTLAIHQTIGVAVAKMTVQPVGISDRQCGNP